MILFHFRIQHGFQTLFSCYSAFQSIEMMIFFIQINKQLPIIDVGIQYFRIHTFDKEKKRFFIWLMQLKAMQAYIWFYVHREMFCKIRTNELK